jgi:hypothetical protein
LQSFTDLSEDFTPEGIVDMALHNGTSLFRAQLVGPLEPALPIVETETAAFGYLSRALA